MVAAAQVQEVRRVLSAVHDPEIPVLTIEDLGVLRNVVTDQGRLTVYITPTYSGCPAMHAIEAEIVRVLKGAGYGDAAVKTTLSPAWSPDWISEEGRRKLREYGIAPPVRCGMRADAPVPCPRCGSAATEQISSFGSTACKALHRCRDCLEPFDYFKRM